MSNDASKKYGDIINLPHHNPKTKPRMSIYDRAAQFSPFAALTGHDEVIDETARLTDKYSNLSEETERVINEKLSILNGMIDKSPKVSVVYFKPDLLKDGGKYLLLTGNIKKIKEYEKKVVFDDGTTIDIDSITDIHSEEIDKFFE